MSFFGELSRRNVIRVGIAYAIVAWLILQVADIVLENIGAPAWVMQTLMLLLALGFVVVVIFAWAYEVTPEGIKRESEIDRSASITGVTGHKLNRVITGLLIVALAYFIWESRIADRPASEPETTAAEIVAEASEVFEVVATAPTALSIAVLPFENRSAEANDAFFAEGMHDDLLTTLAKIGSMKVISRTSVMRYEDTNKTIPEIAKELGVATILEGGVQRSGTKVRINVQLIDANTDEHLWAEFYDRELTAENLFGIQSEISKAIADALHATLSPEEVDRIDTVPTQSLDALDHYLRGRQVMATRAVSDLEQATQEFLKAVEVDPGFALAWVGVADSHALLSAYGNLPQGVFQNVRDDAINRALTIDPQLGEAYASLGSLLQDQGDDRAAEEAFRTAIRYSPNYATAHHWLSNMMKWNPARGPEALPHAQRAVELDPNSAIIIGNLADTYYRLGDITSAERYFRQTREAHPDFAQAHDGYADVLDLQGNFADAVESRKKAIELDPDNPSEAVDLAFAYAQIGAFEEARAVHQTMQERFSDHGLTEVLGIATDLAAGETANIRSVVAAALEQEGNFPGAFGLGYMAMLVGEFDLAYDAFDRATPTTTPLNEEEITPEFLTTWLGTLCEFSWVFLETEGNEALGEELLDASIQLYESGFHPDIRLKERYGWSLCYLLRGEDDKALTVLQRELDNHLVGNWPWNLKSQPYDAIRDDPRFIAMYSEFESRMAGQLAKLRAQNKPAFEF